MAFASNSTTLGVGLKHFVIGFVTGFIVAVFGLEFLGLLSLSNDLSEPELVRNSRSLWLALYFAFGTGVVAMLFGKRQFSLYWLWFVIAFGTICVIPFWRHKDESLLPLGTPYVNFGFQAGDARLLIVHLFLSLIAAAIIHWVWRMTRRLNKSK